MAIDGTYKGAVKSIMGSMDCEMTVKQEDSELTGTVAAMGITSQIQDGKVEGDAFSCVVEGDGPTGHMVLNIKGTVRDGKVTGTVKAGRIKAKLEATRV